MNPITHLAMIGWIPIVLLLFSQLEKPRHAVIAAFIFAWLFLPVASYPIPVLPDYTKMSATCFGVLLGAVLFDIETLLDFKLSIADTPMICWIVAPFISSMTNGLGLWDAIAALFNNIVIWGLPYFIGRIYLSDAKALKELAVGFMVGGLVYIPLCMLESRISPQLHRILYGFMAHYDFSQTYRMGGWRPMVFMEHGLMVGAWMMAATLNSVWMYSHSALNNLKEKLHLKWTLPVLYFTAAWIRSFGAFMLLNAGLALLWLSVRLRTRLLLAALVIFPVLQMSTAVVDEPILQAASDIIASINEDRAASLQFRIDNEHILLEKALQRPVFGWGGWGRARVYNEFGEDISVTDSLWIITIGNYGLFGLTALTLTLLLPVILFGLRWPIASWSDPRFAHVASIAVMITLYSVDNLINAMVNPLFMFSCGALTGTMLCPFSEIPEQTNGQAQNDLLVSRPYKTRFI